MAAGTPPDTIIATGRDTDKFTALACDGVTVRRADFADPRTLTDAFAGAETLLLISKATVGERFDNHRRSFVPGLWFWIVIEFFGSPGGPPICVCLVSALLA